MTTLLEILQHALGRNEFGQRKRGLTEDYRNHFCTSEGGADWNICEEAVRAGLMTKHAPSAISGGDWIFCVTPNGKAHVDHASPKPPKVSRSRARYLAWLNADTGLPFSEWIRHRR
jgi:hypothetical protein